MNDDAYILDAETGYPRYIVDSYAKYTGKKFADLPDAMQQRFRPLPPDPDRSDIAFALDND